MHFAITTSDQTVRQMHDLLLVLERDAGILLDSVLLILPCHPNSLLTRSEDITQKGLHM